MLPVALSGGRKCFLGEIALQMLDAAHGEAVGPVGSVQRPHVARAEEQVARIVVAGVVGRRAPDIALRADVRQGSRRVVAVARSRA